MINCPNCNTPINVNVDFCPNCGANIRVIREAQSQTPIVNNTNNVTNKKRNNTSIVLIIVIIFIIFVIVLTLLNFLRNRNNNNPTNPGIIDNKPTENNPIKDKTIDNNVNENSKFTMLIADVFVINGSTVVTGKINKGVAHIGDEVEIVGASQNTLKTKIDRIEAYSESVNSAENGVEVTIYLSGVKREDIQRGQMLATPNTIKPTNKIDVDITLRKYTGKSLTDNMEVYVNSIEMSIKGIAFTAGKTLEPGDNEIVTIELTEYAALEVNQKISIVDDGITVAEGKVIKLY